MVVQLKDVLTEFNFFKVLILVLLQYVGFLRLILRVGIQPGCSVKRWYRVQQP